MFFELTELLACPSCGPAHGLVLLVKDVEDRRVASGWLGCPECRRDYPVRDGVADLRLEPDSAASAAGREEPLEEDELALKIAALCGLRDGPGYLLVVGRLAHTAPGLSELLPGVEIIALKRFPDEVGEVPGVSRVLADMRFPLVDHRLRAVALAPGADPEQVAAACRLVAVGGRLVLFEASDTDTEGAERSGLKIVARQGRVAVAERNA